MPAPRPSPLALVLALVAGCHASRPAPAAAPAPAPVEGLLATVDGRSITRAEVLASMRSAPSHGGAAETEAEALERVIQEEVLAQHARALHLDDDPAFREQDRLAEARFHAARRAQLAALAERRIAALRPAVGEAEVRAFYEANVARIRREVHVQQILLRDEAAAQQAARDVAAGAAFEEVARRPFAGLDPSLRPWDLGFLRWNVVPDAWLPALATLSPGQTSGVIAGPNHRYWIIKLVERRDAPDVTLDVARPAILQSLQEGAATARRSAEAATLRQRARVVIAPPAAR
jgi:peptidyl-prolyl cis-trans isomerase C